jgi:hypothetical protein
MHLSIENPIRAIGNSDPHTCHLTSHTTCPYGTAVLGSVMSDDSCHPCDVKPYHERKSLLPQSADRTHLSPVLARVSRSHHNRKSDGSVGVTDCRPTVVNNHYVAGTVDGVPPASPHGSRSSHITSHSLWCAVEAVAGMGEEYLPLTPVVRQKKWSRRSSGPCSWGAHRLVARRRTRRPVMHPLWAAERGERVQRALDLERT